MEAVVPGMSNVRTDGGVRVVGAKLPEVRVQGGHFEVTLRGKVVTHTGRGTVRQVEVVDIKAAGHVQVKQERVGVTNVGGRQRNEMPTGVVGNRRVKNRR